MEIIETLKNKQMFITMHGKLISKKKLFKMIEDNVLLYD